MAGNKGKKGGWHTPKKNAKNEQKASWVSQEKRTMPNNESEETSQEEIVNISQGSEMADGNLKKGYMVKNDDARAGAVAAGQKRKIRENDAEDLGAPRSQVVKGCQPEVPRCVHGNDKQQCGQGQFDLGQMEIGGSPSELTIYKRAVPMCTDADEHNNNLKRISNSSEEMVDISDESAEGFDNTNVVVQNISDKRWNEDRRETRPSVGRYVDDGQVAHSSRQEPPLPLMRP